MEPRTAPQDRPLSVAVAGMAALAVAMGVGRFAFTPLLPMMLHDGVVTLAGGSWLATANYLGYLIGALACMALPWVAPRARQRWHAARLARFFGQRQQAVGIAAQRLPGRRQHHALALAQEQRGAELLLQLLHACGHVGLHAAQSLGRAGDAAFLRHGPENFEGGKIHNDSCYEMIIKK